MKRLMFVLIVVLLGAFTATPAFADNGRGDHVCFGGTTTVGANATPDSVVLFGCGARIAKGAQVSRDVVSFGGDVVIEEGASVAGDVVIFGGDIDVAGEIGHRIMSFGGGATLESTAVIGDDVRMFGGGLDRKEGATVRGQILRNSSTTFPRVRFVPPVPSFRYGVWSIGNGIVEGFINGLVTTFGLAALGVLIIVFLPNQLKQVGDVAQQSALPSLGVGCLTWLVVPPLMILFILTCLGIPLSALMGILFVAAGVLGWVAISAILGDRLLNALKVQNSVPILAMVAGLIVLWFVTAIPFLGGLIWVFATSLAIGAVVLTRFGTQPYPPPMPTAPATVAPTAPPALPTPTPTPPTDDSPSI